MRGDGSILAQVGQQAAHVGGRETGPIAMPDGDAYSYYTTYNVLLTAAGCRELMLPPGGSAEHDCVAWPHYDDYIAYDIVRYVDATYRTSAAGDRTGCCAATAQVWRLGRARHPAGRR